MLSMRCLPNIVVMDVAQFLRGVCAVFARCLRGVCAVFAYVDALRAYLMKAMISLASLGVTASLVAPDVKLTTNSSSVIGVGAEIVTS